VLDERFRSLVEAASPAVLTTYRRDGSALTSPVGDVTEARLAIAGRYLGAEDGARFAAQRRPNGTLVRLPLDGARTWDLSAILP
jgi:hypothetical protein